MDTILSRILECMGPQHGAGKALADFLGINPNVITNWKNGSNRSYRKYLKQIAEHYGVTEDYLLTGERKENAPTTEGERSVGDLIDEVDIAFYGNYRELDNDDKETIRAMVQVMRERRAKKQE